MELAPRSFVTSCEVDNRFDSRVIPNSRVTEVDYDFGWIELWVKQVLERRY